MLTGMGGEAAAAHDVDGSRAAPPEGHEEAGAGTPADPHRDPSRPARWRGHDSRRIVGAALVLLWVVWLAVLWVGQVRVVPLSTLEDDLEAGRVVTFREVVLDRDGGAQWSGTAEVVHLDVDDLGVLTGRPEESGRGIRAVAYRVDGRVATQRVVDPRLIEPSYPEETIGVLRSAGIPPDTGFGSDFHGQSDRIGQVSAVLGLVTVGLIVAGPRPGRGTRWFWFWLLPAPLALGVLAFAVVELIRPGRLGGPDAGRSRYQGLLGLLVGWIGGGLLALGLSALADLAPVLLVRP